MNAYPVWDSVPACQGTDTDLWFTAEESKVYTQIVLLKKICSECPVRKQCLDYAIHHNVNGYWAGTTESNRSLIQRQRNIIPKSLITSEY